MLGAFARATTAFMVVLPTQREGWLSDAETLSRFAQRPQTVVDALYLAQKDVIMGLAAALAGGRGRGPPSP